MCGIAGFVNFKNNVELAHKANKIQRHRGPDFQGVWHDEYISLAHQRLSIIDVSERSNQPFIKENYVIVFNGEVYNYKELKSELLRINPLLNFITSSDTEVVLEYYKHYKQDALKYFRGMFSFAIYDMVNKELFAARDQFGIKPFYYTFVGESFAFSSELKTLAIIPGFDKSISIEALINSLNYLWLPADQCIYKSSHKLLPGHYLILESNGNHKITRYFELSKERYEIKDEKQIIDKLDKYLLDSIEKHLVADVPISSFLSGGLDSSLVSVLSRKLLSNLSTYTIATKGEDKKVEKMSSDEAYAQIVADKYGMDHNEITLDPEIVDLLPKIVYHLDEPIGDPAAINTYLICKEANKKGVKVLLSGMGADEIFLGYRRQKAILISLKYRKLPSSLKLLIKWFIDLLPVRLFNKGFRFSRWAKKFISFAELPLSEAYRMSYSYYNKDELFELLNYRYSAEINQLECSHNELFNNSGYDDIENKMCNTDIYRFMEGLNLTYTDRASMACSVEVRVPFIDKEVIGLAMSIPGQLKYKNNQSKYILKKVSESYLPNSIIYRPKASFGAPIRSWVSGKLKPVVDDLLSEENIKKRGFFNYNYIKTLIDNDRNGIEDNAYRIYQLLTLEIWFRQNMDMADNL